MVNPDTMTTFIPAPWPATWLSRESLGILGGGIDRLRERERDRIDALDFDRVRPRTPLLLGLAEWALPLRPLEPERSRSPSVSILLSLVFFPLADDVIERGLGDRPRDDMLVFFRLACADYCASVDLVEFK